MPRPLGAALLRGKAAPSGSSSGNLTPAARARAFLTPSGPSGPSGRQEAAVPRPCRERCARRRARPAETCRGGPPAAPRREESSPNAVRARNPDGKSPRRVAAGKPAAPCWAQSDDRLFDGPGDMPPSCRLLVSLQKGLALCIGVYILYLSSIYTYTRSWRSWDVKGRCAGRHRDALPAQ